MSARPVTCRRRRSPLRPRSGEPTVRPSVRHGPETAAAQPRTSLAYRSHDRRRAMASVRRATAGARLIWRSHTANMAVSHGRLPTDLAISHDRAWQQSRRSGHGDLTGQGTAGLYFVRFTGWIKIHDAVFTRYGAGWQLWGTKPLSLA